MELQRSKALRHASRSSAYRKLILLLCFFAGSSILLSAKVLATSNGQTERIGERFLVIQRMVEAQRAHLEGAKKGTLIYQVDGKSGYWYFDGTGWTAVSGEDLKVVRPAVVEGGNWILSVPGGQQLEVLAPVTRVGVAAFGANGTNYDFDLQITLRPGGEAQFASRVRSVYPQLSALEIQGTKVHASFLKEASNAEINSFFNQLGCNVIQPIN